MDVQTLTAAGWRPVEGIGFTSTLGTIWSLKSGDLYTLGFISDARHGNNHAGVVHGGALMTFADICLGYSVARALGSSSCVTAQLQIQFVSSGPLGSFISCQPEIVRKGAQLIFVRGLIRADDRTIASADGIWKVLEQKPRP